MMQKISVKCTEKGGNNCWRCDVLQPDLGCGWCEGSKVCTAVSQCAVSYKATPMTRNEAFYRKDLFEFINYLIYEVLFQGWAMEEISWIHQSF